MNHNLDSMPVHFAYVASDINAGDHILIRPVDSGMGTGYRLAERSIDIGYTRVELFSARINRVTRIGNTYTFNTNYGFITVLAMEQFDVRCVDMTRHRFGPATAVVPAKKMASLLRQIKAYRKRIVPLGPTPTQVDGSRRR